MTESIGRAGPTVAPPVETPRWTTPGRGTLAGAPEMLVAQVAMQLEEAGDRSADVSRRMRKSQRQSARSALDEKRKAAKFRLAAGITQAAGQAASAAVSIGQASSNLQAANANAVAEQHGRDEAFMTEQHGASDVGAQRSGELASKHRLEAAEFQAQGQRLGSYGQLAQAGAGAIASGLSYAAERRDIQAEQLNQNASVHAESAELADEARESAQRFADKAMQHMSDIEQAKHRAAMAPLRG